MQHLSPTPSLRIMHLRIIYVSACLNSFFHFIVAEYVIVHQFPSWRTFGFCFAVVRYYEKCCHKHSHRGFRVGAQRLISLGRIWKSEIAVPCAQGGFAGNCQTSSRPAAWIHTPTGNARQFHFCLISTHTWYCQVFFWGGGWGLVVCFLILIGV